MSSTDFALIGHPESWSAASSVLTALRGSGQPPISLEDIRDILPWIPPRTVCRVSVRSTRGGEARGVYIDSFLPPDRLDGRYLHENLERVRAAVEWAIGEGAAIVSLGGFSSILLEGKLDLLPPHAGTAFTTGNTLTVALIVQGIERAAALAGRDLRDSAVLIVGASGDVGSGCTRYLSGKVGRLLLSARNPLRLRMLAASLPRTSSRIEADTDIELLAARADFVICAASLPVPSLVLDRLKPGAVICDAGFPKNVRASPHLHAGAVFFGGMGEATGGFRLEPDLLGILNPYPFPNAAHGCLLEGVALAFERRFEPFSSGRGRITPERVDEIAAIALSHGIALAPLFDAEGPVEGRIAALSREVSA